MNKHEHWAPKDNNPQAIGCVIENPPPPPSFFDGRQMKLVLDSDLVIKIPPMWRWAVWEVLYENGARWRSNTVFYNDNINGDKKLWRAVLSKQIEDLFEYQNAPIFGDARVSCIILVIARNSSELGQETFLVHR